MEPIAPLFSRPTQTPTPEQLASCPSQTSLNVVSVNVGFEYEGLSDLARGAVNDLNYFSELAKSFTPRRNIFRFGNTLVTGANPKEQFLKALRESVQGKNYVNFNFAGHGLRLPNGEFAMVLPSLPDRLVKWCLSKRATREEDFNLNLGEGGVEAHADGLERNSDPFSLNGPLVKKSPDCSLLEKHIVRDRELREVFGDRKVFGLIDACYSGSMDLGPHSAMGYASLPDQIANQSKVRGRSVRGDFTYKFEEALRGSQCKLDSNGDRRISYREALAVTGQSTKQVIPWWAECFLVDQSPQSSGDCENHFQVGDEVQAAQTFEITDSQGRACTIQHNETLIISQSSSTTRGQVKLEAPQRCGFQSGVTRALNLRNLPANNVRVPAPAGGLQQGPGTK